MVRQRGGKAGPSRIKLCRKDSSETLPGRDEGETAVTVETKVSKPRNTVFKVNIFFVFDKSDVSIETAPPADPTLEKVKKRYRKKKTKLEEAFPSYLQVTLSLTHRHSSQSAPVF